MAYRRTDHVVQQLAARRDAIVAAARELAAEAGMDAVQIVPVAAHAGIAAGTVYRYFPSKTDLVAAVVADAATREVAAIRQAAAAAPGPLSALAAAIVTCAARTLNRQRLTWALMGEPVGPPIEALRAVYRKALATEFAARIGAAVAEGHLPEQDPALAAAALIGALTEGLAGPLAPAPAKDETQARAAVQDVALMALRALGVVDARARGLVVQAALPAIETAA